MRKRVLKISKEFRAKHARRAAADKRRRAKLVAKGFRWEHIGGGTDLALLGAKGEKGRFPCDEHYVNLVTGDSVIYASTYRAHFDRVFPEYARSLSGISRRKDAKKIATMTKDGPYTKVKRQ